MISGEFFLRYVKVTPRLPWFQAYIGKCNLAALSATLPGEISFKGANWVRRGPAEPGVACRGAFGRVIKRQHCNRR